MKKVINKKQTRFNNVKDADRDLAKKIIRYRKTPKKFGEFLHIDTNKNLTYKEKVKLTIAKLFKLIITLMTLVSRHLITFNTAYIAVMFALKANQNSRNKSLFNTLKLVVEGIFLTYKTGNIFEKLVSVTDAISLVFYDLPNIHTLVSFGSYAKKDILKSFIDSFLQLNKGLVNAHRYRNQNIQKLTVAKRNIPKNPPNNPPNNSQKSSSSFSSSSPKNSQKSSKTSSRRSSPRDSPINMEHLTWAEQMNIEDERQKKAK